MMSQGTPEEKEVMVIQLEEEDDDDDDEKYEIEKEEEEKKENDEEEEEEYYPFVESEKGVPLVSSMSKDVPTESVIRSHLGEIDEEHFQSFIRRRSSELDMMIGSEDEGDRVREIWTRHLSTRRSKDQEVVSEASTYGSEEEMLPHMQDLSITADRFESAYTNRWRRMGGYGFVHKMLMFQELPSRIEKEGPDTHRLEFGRHMEPIILERMESSGLKIHRVPPIIPRDYPFMEDAPDGIANGILPYPVPIEVKAWLEKGGRYISLNDLIQCTAHCIVMRKTYCIYYRWCKEGDSHFMALVKKNEDLARIIIEGARSNYNQTPIDSKSQNARIQEAISSKGLYHTIFYSEIINGEREKVGGKDNDMYISWNKAKLNDFIKRMTGSNKKRVTQKVK